MNESRKIDELAAAAGGYFAMPSPEDIEFSELFADICAQFKIRYYSATPKERCFVEEVARVTWERRKAKTIGDYALIRPAFTV